MAEKVSQGDSIFNKLSASMHNDTIDMLAWWKRNRALLGSNQNRNLKRDPDCSTRIRMKNASDANRRQGEVLKVGTLLTTDVSHSGLNSFSGSVPTATDDEVAVLLQAISYGTDDTGVCQISGVCPALVDIQTEGDEWALIDPDSAVLISGSSGLFKILYAPSGTGEKECVVLLDRTATDGVPFHNDSGETIPPYACMEVTGVTSGVYQCNKPSTTFNRRYLINRGVSVLSEANGIGTWLEKAGKALIDESPGTALHSEYGAKSGQWELARYRSGFHMWAWENFGDDMLGTFIQREVIHLIGKTTDTEEGIPMNSSGALTVYNGSLDAIEFEITAQSPFGAIAANKWCSITFQSGFWIAAQIEC